MALQGASFLFQGIGYFFVGLFVLIGLAILFGDKKLWEYEVQGHCEACEKGKLEIELKSLKKRGTTIEVEGRFKSQYLNKEVLVELNGYKLASFDAAENDGSRYQLEKTVEMREPKAGDLVSLHVGGEEIFAQKLYAD
jgi:hypothetical protein